MIEQSIPVIQKVTEFVQSHVPAEQLPGAIRVILPMLFLGVGLSVFGARLARPFIALLFAAAGLIVSMGLRDQIQITPLVLTVAGVGIAGLIGYFGYRLWAGILIAFLAVSVSLGVYGNQNVIPHVSTFESAVMQNPNDFTIPDAQAQDVPPVEKLENLADSFWTHVRNQNASVDKSIQRIAIGVGLVSFVIAVCCIRWALILACSSAGVFLTATGALASLYAFSPARYQQLSGHETKLGLAILAAFLFSVFLQSSLTKKRKVVVEEEEE